MTGHAGLRQGLSSRLHALGANVFGLALAPGTAPSLFETSGISNLVTSTIALVRDVNSISQAINAHEPEIVFRLAAELFVRESCRDPIGTFATNVVGTAAVLDACPQSSFFKAVVWIVADRAYLNLKENSPPEKGERLRGLIQRQ